jgi:hypothetical protein
MSKRKNAMITVYPFWYQHCGRQARPLGFVHMARASHRFTCTSSHRGMLCYYALMPGKAEFLEETANTLG